MRANLRRTDSYQSSTRWKNSSFAKEVTGFLGPYSQRMEKKEEQEGKRGERDG